MEMIKINSLIAPMLFFSFCSFLYPTHVFISIIYTSDIQILLCDNKDSSSTTTVVIARDTTNNKSLCSFRFGKIKRDTICDGGLQWQK